MSRPPATSRKLRRVLVLLALFLLCLPESKTSALNSVRGVPEQLQASSADGAGFAWSGGRALSKVGVVIYIYIYIYIYFYMAWRAEDVQARARSVPPGIWARNLLVARRAKAGS